MTGGATASINCPATEPDRMERRTVAGGGLLVAGLVGYGLGVYVPYPGRSFSLTAVMVGIALVATAQRARTEAEP